MIEIQIGEFRRREDQAGENWIHQQINRRRADGLPVCVQIIIKEGTLDVVLMTPQCPQGRSKRTLTQQEQAIVDMWNECGLNRNNFGADSVVTFLKKVHKYV